jgi:hypothetical protein
MGRDQALDALAQRVPFGRAGVSRSALVRWFFLTAGTMGRASNIIVPSRSSRPSPAGGVVHPFGFSPLRIARPGLCPGLRLMGRIASEGGARIERDA